MTKKSAILFLFLFAGPLVVRAEVTKFVFTSNPQSIKPNQVSDVLSVQSQDSSSAPSNTTQTVCLELTTTSNSGEFSSSNTNWNSVSVLTMNKGSANRNFYYKDTTPGTFSLSVKAAPRPETETRPCASWPVNEWGSGWVARQDMVVGEGAPTPVVPSNTTETGNSGISGISGVELQFSEQKIYADAGQDKTVVVGAEEKFIGHALGFKKEPLEGGRYVWSFGDGSVSENKEATHTYKYPGQYVATFKANYYSYSASDRITVKVISSQITISEVSGEFIKLSNSSNEEIDISNWLFKYNGLTFRLPETTIIGASGELVIPNSVSNLKISSKDESVELLYPNGSVAYVYSAKAESIAKVSGTRRIIPAISAGTLPNGIEVAQSATSTGMVLDKNLASLIYTEETDKGNSNVWLLPTAGVGLLAALGYVSIKRQKQKEEIVPEKAGDEFFIEEDKF